MPVWNLYINGQWRAPRNEQYDPAYDPATGEVLAQSPKRMPKTPAKPSAPRAQAFDDGPWPQMAPGERSRMLHKLVDALEERQAEIADLEMMNGGCTWRKANLMDIPVGLLHFRHFAKLADYRAAGAGAADHLSHAQSTTSCAANRSACAARSSRGTFPFLMAVWKIAPALAAGNCVVLKPASYTPLSALKMIEIIHDTGLLPPGVLNLITGPGGVVGPELCVNPLVDKIAFTGSTEVGRQVMQTAASTIKKVTLELGGKSPNIILDDAELDIAIDGSLWATFMHNGQACESGTRLFVPDSLYDEFMERLLDRASKIKVGLPADGATDLGPLISAGQLQTVENYIQIGLEEGATPALLGQRPTDPELANGHFITPTIFTDVRNDMRIAQEEIFGPVLAVIKYDSLEDAIKQANDTIYGLAAGVWSANLERAVSVANNCARARCGSTTITSSMRKRRLAATSKAASAASWARGACTHTPKSSTSTPT